MNADLMYVLSKNNPDTDDSYNISDIYIESHKIEELDRHHKRLDEEHFPQLPFY